MTATVENILISFEKLTEPEKRDLALEVVRRTNLSDDEQDFLAEDLFLAVKREETE